MTQPFALIMQNPQTNAIFAATANLQAMTVELQPFDETAILPTQLWMLDVAMDAKTNLAGFAIVNDNNGSTTQVIDNGSQAALTLSEYDPYNVAIQTWGLIAQSDSGFYLINSVNDVTTIWNDWGAAIAAGDPIYMDQGVATNSTWLLTPLSNFGNMDDARSSTEGSRSLGGVA